MRTPRPVPAAVAVVVLSAAIGVTVWRPWEESADATGGPSGISVSRSQCGQGWTDAKTGRQTLVVHNTGDAAAEVDLVEVGSKKVYGEVEGLGPNTSASMDVQLGAGQYAIRCLIEDTDAITGPTVTLTGDGAGRSCRRPGQQERPAAIGEEVPGWSRSRCRWSGGEDGQVARGR